MFSICLVAMIVQMVYTMLIGGGLEVSGPSGLIMPALVIIIAAALLWFSWLARTRGWFGTVNSPRE
jgi:MFS superfamily sulfate permease-like transporter